MAPKKQQISIYEDLKKQEQQPNLTEYSSLKEKEQQSNEPLHDQFSKGNQIFNTTQNNKDKEQKNQKACQINQLNNQNHNSHPQMNNQIKSNSKQQLNWNKLINNLMKFLNCFNINSQNFNMIQSNYKKNRNNFKQQFKNIKINNQLSQWKSNRNSNKKQIRLNSIGERSGAIYAKGTTAGETAERNQKLKELIRIKYWKNYFAFDQQGQEKFTERNSTTQELTIIITGEGT